jgi:hypothetical protein
MYYTLLNSRYYPTYLINKNNYVQDYFEYGINLKLTVGFNWQLYEQFVYIKQWMFSIFFNIIQYNVYQYILLNQLPIAEFLFLQTKLFHNSNKEKKEI